ncbi:unnamed protein product [Ceutorhynchus assimilis]|uniref:Beta-hexosaminidase n=1 Tax=Ceutorhynchus assimilis TaxID=467358 RepID=A0A9N9MD61_9CUCU|nr:unnamed protein product [Ceutorhynchus assimilis]
MCTNYTGFKLLLCCLLLSTVRGWVWECTPAGSCQRRDPHVNDTFFNSLDVCRLVCGDRGNIWPLPANYTTKNKDLVYIDAKNIVFSIDCPTTSANIYLGNVVDYFKDVINENDEQNCSKTKYKLILNVNVANSILILNYKTSEEYSLDITTDSSSKTVTVNIIAVTIFGARHAFESLLQLIETESTADETCFVTLKEVSIQDKPKYKHRGLLLDSARNFLSVEVIKKNIIAMGMSKLNTLHWHMSDSQSFPFVSARVPNMTSYGAYSAAQTYSPYEIRDLLQFAKLHGVRIIPEIDGPAHTGSGWQWGADAGLGDLIVCYNKLPYKSFCIQPPCGQMNPANPNLYQVLGNIYADILDLWTDGLDLFHMGGDEVYIPCWNSSQEIVNYIDNNRSPEAFHKLWSEYQEKALSAFDAVNADATEPSSAILWTSSLTEISHVEKYVPKERYIIQTWVSKSDPLPKELLDLGYKLIISTKDSWYLDHGFWGTTKYYTWRTVYDNTILNDAAVLGGEVCMWGELVDNSNVEPRVWPRAAAAAERLWTNPSTTSIEATSRFFSHNDRLARRGVRTSPVVPKYCSQSHSDCIGYLVT